MRIKARRKALGLTQQELANRLKTSRLRIIRLETGQTKIKTDDLPVFAKALRTTAQELL